MQPWDSSRTTTLPPAGSRYWTFYDEVSAAQVREWLPARPCRVLDVSGAGCRFLRAVVAAGHTVVHALPRLPERPAPPPPGLQRVVADARWLDWVRDTTVDAVLAEHEVLSACLATEVTIEDIARVLRPGGRLLLAVDSLVQGLAQLAHDGRWAELADAPAADVVLVPTPGGAIRRCFWPDELQGVLADAGLVVDWVRARTVLSPDAVERALADEPASLERLVRTELALESNREGDWVGAHLVASARKPVAG